MISHEEILRLHELSIEKFGGANGIRDVNLLKSAAARPLQGFGDELFYKTPFEQAAALAESIIKNHPFIDGNKRTGFLSAAVFLLKNKLRLTATEDEAYDFVIAIASSQTSFEDIAAWLQTHTAPVV